MTSIWFSLWEQLLIVIRVVYKIFFFSNWFEIPVDIGWSVLMFHLIAVYVLLSRTWIRNFIYDNWGFSKVAYCVRSYLHFVRNFLIIILLWAAMVFMMRIFQSVKVNIRILLFENTILRLFILKSFVDFLSTLEAVMSIFDCFKQTFSQIDVNFFMQSHNDTLRTIFSSISLTIVL